MRRSARFGEVVAAFVKLRGSYRWDGPDEVLAHLEGVKLAKAKLPVHWHIVAALPTSATGKIVKQKLLELI